MYCLPIFTMNKMEQNFMNIADIGSLRLEYEFFGTGPGMDGISSLSLTEKNGKYYCKFSADITDEREKWTSVGIYAPTDNWRKVANKVLSMKVAAAQDQRLIFPEDMRAFGSETFGSQLISAAFCGGVVAEITRDIIILSDYQLNLLFNHKKLSKQRTVWNKLIKLKAVCDEINKDFSHFLTRQKNNMINLIDLKKDIQDYIKLKKMENKFLQENINWQLKPYQVEIEKIIKNWKNSQHISSTNGSITRSIKANKIKDYIERYIIINHAIPTGNHQINSRNDGKNEKIDINFDNLFDDNNI